MSMAVVAAIAVTATSIHTIESQREANRQAGQARDRANAQFEREMKMIEDENKRQEQEQADRRREMNEQREQQRREQAERRTMDQRNSALRGGRLAGNVGGRPRVDSKFGSIANQAFNMGKQGSQQNTLLGGNPGSTSGAEGILKTLLGA